MAKEKFSQKKLKNFVAANWPPADAEIAKTLKSRLLQVENPDEILFEEIDKAFSAKKPLLIGRLGGTEARVIGAWLRRQSGIQFSIKSLTNFLWPGPYKKRANQLQLGAGFYPLNRESIDKFVSIYLEILPAIDVLGAWGKAFAWPESLVGSNVSVVPLESLSPWIEPWSCRSSDNRHIFGQGHSPWSFALEHKKVLVVTPFAETAAAQFKRIHLIFSTKYPKMNVQFIKAPMSMGGLADGSTWFSKLQELKNNIERSNFDIALISAGSYSLPIAAHVKNLGKIGIHAGGALQLFFGILGRRWESQDWVTKWINDFWVRPSLAETPKISNKVENGCYW